MSDEEELTSTPQEITNIAQEVTENLLPAKSKKLYNKAYEHFMEWRLKKKIASFSENVLLVYFQEIGAKFASSTLWSEFSMLKSTLNIYQKIDISKFAKLNAFLKRKSQGYQAKKSKTFSPEEVNQFVNTAPDELYLLTKVAVIFGIMGACRRQELYSLLNENVQDMNGALLVKVINTKNRIDRTFTVTGNYYEICKKYINLRPKNSNNTHFFIRCYNGTCSAQNIGINIFGDMGKKMAIFLNLPHPELYTGHCFRRTSATLLIDAGGDITALKRHGGWKSTAVAEGYIDNSIQSKLNVSNTILSSIERNNLKCLSTSTSVIHNTRQPMTSTNIPRAPRSTFTPSNIESQDAAFGDINDTPSPTFTPTNIKSQPSAFGDIDHTPSPAFTTPNIESQPAAHGDINLSQVLKHAPVIITKNNIQNLHIHYQNK